MSKTDYNTPIIFFSNFRRMEKFLEEIFKHLNSSYKSLESRLKAEGFKARVLQVIKAWEEWLVYDRDYLTKLKTIFLGIQHVRICIICLIEIMND